MSKTTVSLHPVPSGTVLIREGERNDVVYRLEGGHVALTRSDTPLMQVGSGAVVGVAGAVLGGPQLFTVTGSDRASFAKKYLLAEIGDLLASDEEAPAMLLSALEAEIAVVEGRGHAKQGAPARILDGVAAEVGLLLQDVGGSPAARVAGEGLARSVAAGATPADVALQARAILRTAKGCAGIYALPFGPERTRRAVDLLAERANALKEACERL